MLYRVHLAIENIWKVGLMILQKEHKKIKINKNKIMGSKTS
jgi:hypothetical protein